MDGDAKQPHAQSLRKGRVSLPQQIYLVTAVTRNRKNVFEDFRYGRLLVQSFLAYEQYARTLCYVVMPDHFHWMLQLQKDADLSITVAAVKRRASRCINRTRNTRGGLWQDGFHDRALREEEDIKAVARYVVANPLRAGLVQRIGDYSLWDAVWL